MTLPPSPAPESTSEPPALRTAARPAVPKREVPNHTVLAVISLIACFPPTGAVALVYSLRVDTLLAAGDIPAARIASRKSLQWSVASIVLGAIVTVALVALGLALLMPFIEAL